MTSTRMITTSSIITSMRAPIAYFTHSQVVSWAGGAGGEDDGDGTGGGGGDMAGGEVVVKAPAALQALLVPEPSALTFQ